MQQDDPKIHKILQDATGTFISGIEKARESAARSTDKNTRTSLKKKAKKKHWLGLRHYQLDMLDRVAIGTHPNIKSMIYKKLLND